MIQSIKKIYDTKYRLKKCDSLINNLINRLGKKQLKSKEWRKNVEISPLIFLGEKPPQEIKRKKIQTKESLGQES